ncbi:expressed unknown protein [Seminavis robusta]|uniref:Uncharacterized protein n=1 Tax=Seminavis robusta TaxID=568900 RepID=A0A9N8H2R8_9STRA|nr:expressed unknown protein [Seminavis robusta]|eukprot:Sro42_g025680.1 n/a (139) ;mRNA; r:92083-92499
MGNSPSNSCDLDADTLAFVMEKTKNKRSGSKRNGKGRSSQKSRRRSSCHQASSCAMLDECDVDDILELVQELKRDGQGTELLKEFLDYRMGKSKREPRIFDLLMDRADKSHPQPPPPPISEIQIVLDCGYTGNGHGDL